MKTKLFFVMIIMMMIVAIGCNSSNTSNENETNETEIIRPQDFGNGVFYFDTFTLTYGDAEQTKEYFGKSLSHFIENNAEWKINAISPVIDDNQATDIRGYFVICDAVKK